MDIDFAKPLPRPTPTSQPFWDGLAANKIVIQHCADCATWVFYPRNRCSGCLSDKLEWREVSGDAVLYTFTLTRQPTSPHFADEVPQKLAVVELAEGVRLTSTLINIDEADVRIGIKLKPVFDKHDDVTLLRFEPI